MAVRPGLRFLSVLTIVVGSATIGTIFAQLNLSNAFLYFRVARVIASAGSGGISAFQAEFTPTDPTYFGYEAILIFTTQVGGLRPEELIGFPLGSLLLPIVFLAVARRVVKDHSIGIMLTLYFVSFYALLGVQYDTFVYAFAHVTFLAVVLILASPRILRSKQGVMMLTLLFVGSYFVYHTTPVWIITMMLVVSLPMWYRSRKLPLRRSEGLSLSVAFFVLYVAFNETVYNQLVPVLVGFGPWSVEGLIGSGAYAADGLGGKSILPWLNLAIHVMIVSPLIIWIVAKALTARSSGRAMGQLDRLVAASIVVALSQFVIHGLFGSLSNRLVLLLLPIMALAVIWAPEDTKGEKSERWRGSNGGWLSRVQTHRKTIALTVAALVASLSLSTFVAFYVEKAPGIDLSPRNRSGQWLMGVSDDEPRLMSDLDTFGIVEVGFARDGRIAHLLPYDDSLYDWLVGRLSSPPAVPDFVLMDIGRTGQPISGLNWQQFPGSAESQTSAAMNPQLELVYDNGAILILKVS